MEALAKKSRRLLERKNRILKKILKGTAVGDSFEGKDGLALAGGRIGGKKSYGLGEKEEKEVRLIRGGISTMKKSR